MQKEYFVYIMASNRNGTLYVGVTNDLVRRVFEHKQKVNKAFTSKYDVTKLVYYEQTSDIHEAITREKRIKSWKRRWKLGLIEAMNPDWDDLFETLL